jgi:YVTN family beta-propeller protein
MTNRKLHATAPTTRLLARTIAYVVVTATAIALVPPCAWATAGNYVIDSISDAGGKPERVAITPDGTKAYVTDSKQDAVLVIDTATRKKTNTIGLKSIGGIPTNLAVSPDGKKLYVLNLSPGSVAVIDTSTDTLAGANNGKVSSYKGTNPYGIAFSPGTSLALVTNNDTEASVSVIDTSKDTQTGTVSGFPSDHGALGVAISSDGTVAYVAQDNGVAAVKVDQSGGTYQQQVQSYTGNTPLNIAFVPGGAKAYVTNQDATGTVSVVDKVNRNYEQTGTVDKFSGKFPADIDITPDGKTAYVTNYGSDDVSVIDVGSHAQTTTVDTAKFEGKRPNGLAFRLESSGKSPIADFAYVANNGSASVVVIKLPLAAAITAIKPSRGPEGSTVTIEGLHLSDTSAVCFGDICPVPTSVTDASVTVNAPTSDDIMPGQVNVIVQNPGGDAMKAKGFTYTTARK